MALKALVLLEPQLRRRCRLVTLRVVLGGLELAGGSVPWLLRNLFTKLPRAPWPAALRFECTADPPRFWPFSCRDVPSAS